MKGAFKINEAKAVNGFSHPYGKDGGGKEAEV
jgi:hypothetical protein